MVSDEIAIAEGGSNKAVIVIAKNAPPPEQHAAEELAGFLKQVTGASFPILDKAPAGANRLLVGPDSAKEADPNFSTEGLGSDGLVIRTIGNDLILAGGRPRGTLYAVYTFLEDVVGCRWRSSKASTIPWKPTLKVPALNVVQVPVLEYREPFWFDAFDGDWAVRNKCNGHAARLDALHGGKHVYEGFVHTFYSLMPPEKYFSTHPEWFSEIGGKRTNQGAQLCLTNEEMRKELVSNLRERLRKNPSATIASVSQNDCQGNCQCPRCAAVDQEEGSPAGSLLRFVNAVATDIEKDFPHVAVSTLAYQYTRKPPRLVRPRKNVIVQLCSIECSFSKPLADERNRQFHEDLAGWSRICDRLYIWDYTTNFVHYLLPHPNLRVLGPNVRLFAGNHVKGIFEQGAYQSHGAEMAELRAWVLAKLLWQPSRDANALTEEFCDGYYGPAGRHVLAYLDVIHNAVETTGDKLGCFSPNTAGFLSLKTLCDGWGHLVAAEAAVKDDPNLLPRVQVAQLSVMYAFLMRWDELRQTAEAQKTAWPMPDSIQTAYEQFVKIAKANSITRLRESKEGYSPLNEAVRQSKSANSPGV